MSNDERVKIARQIRSDVIRMAGDKDVSTVALSFASVELLVYLYGKIVNESTRKSDTAQRDQVVLSDESMLPAHYAVLSQNRFFAREHLWACGSLGSVLQGVASDISTPGIDLPGGMPSLCLAAAWGMGKSRSLQGLSGQVWCIVGPVALQSELFWSSAAILSGWNPGMMSVLLCCVDDGALPCDMKATAEKMSSLGWAVTCCDGHDFDAMDRLCMEERKGQVILFSCQYGKELPFLKELSPKDSMTREIRERALAELNGVKERAGDTWLL